MPRETLLDRRGSVDFLKLTPKCKNPSLIWIIHISIINNVFISLCSFVAIATIDITISYYVKGNLTLTMA